MSQDLCRSRLKMVAFLAIICGSLPLSAAEPTVMIVVRHAEKAPGNEDVPLSEAGKARAQLLRGIVAPLRPNAVYATSTLRARQTAQPTADALSLDLKSYSPADANWSQRLLAENRGKTILVVGHSNTVPEMIQSLAGVKLSIGEDFDQLFIVSFHDHGASLVRLRYGAVSP